MAENFAPRIDAARQAEAKVDADRRKIDDLNAQSQKALADAKAELDGDAKAAAEADSALAADLTAAGKPVVRVNEAEGTAEIFTPDGAGGYHASAALLDTGPAGTPTPEPTPGPNPGPNPEPAPEPTPTPEPNPAPEPGPAPVPGPEPASVPDATPNPTPGPAPVPNLF
jgi:hypothetical protein